MPVFARHIFKQLLHTDVFSWCIFFRLNLSRWTRRTRPTHWYLWPPCPRNPSTNPLSTGSLHQKTGPAPQLTGTLPAGALWLTLRCESHVHVLCRDTPTQVPVHTGTAVTAEAAFTFLPFSFFLNIQCIYMDLSIPVLNDILVMIILNICCRIPFPFGCFQDTNRNMMFTCTNTKMGYLKIQAKPRYSSPCKRMDINHKAHDHMTIRAMPIMWKVEDHCAFRLTRGTSSVPMT